MSYDESERGYRQPTPRSRNWSLYAVAPEALLGIASVALLLLVVASALGWLF